MSRLLKPCASCGELSDGPYCLTHRPAEPVKARTGTRGYDPTWRKLSERARRLQPFCTTCGSRDDLTVDHTPEAWERKAAHKVIRLQDVQVLCRSCNSAKGKAR